MLHQLAIVASLQARRAINDRLLTVTPIIVLLNGLMINRGIPGLQEYCLKAHQIDVGPHVFAIATLIGFVPMSIITSVGSALLLIESREERMDQALLLTPVPTWMPQVTLYGGFALLCMTSLFTLGLLCPVEMTSWGAFAIGALFITAAVMCALSAQVLLANDRATLMGVGKLITGVALMPGVTYLTPDHWDILMGLIPTYWGLQILWLAQANDPSWIQYVFPGVLVVGGWFLGLQSLHARRRR